MGFNKEKSFDESSYVKVNTRLSKFRIDYPEGRITTFRSDTPKGVSFKTIICRNVNDAQEFALTGIAPATGHSFIPYSDMGDKVEEFSETVSVGRALAMLGYDVEKGIASAEEMKRFNDNRTKKNEQVSPTTTQEATPQPEQVEVSDPPSEPLPKLKTSSKFNMAKIRKEE